MQNAVRVQLRAVSLAVAQWLVVTDAQAIALREGIEWPLHCALAVESLPR